MSAVAASAVTALLTCHREPPAGTLLAAVLDEVARVLVVDDAMPAVHAAGLDRLAAALDVDVLRLDRRSGKGHAIAAGLRSLLSMDETVEAVIVLDGDGQHPPERIPDFLSASHAADLVIGNRFGSARDIPLVRRVCNRIASHVVTRTTRQAVPDSQCGMRLLRGRALTEIEFPGGGFEAETRHLKRCLEANVRLAWVPIPAIYDGRPSSFRRVRDSVAVMRAAVGGDVR